MGNKFLGTILFFVVMGTTFGATTVFAEDDNYEIRILENSSMEVVADTDQDLEVDAEIHIFENPQHAQFVYELDQSTPRIELVGGLKGKRRGGGPRALARSCAPPASGVASFYGGKLHGGPIACQGMGRFNQHAMTAAHKTIKCGAKVRVTKTSRSGQTSSVVVTINDAGPYVGGRVIDLSTAAAKQLGIVSSGTARVDLSIVSCN